MKPLATSTFEKIAHICTITAKSCEEPSIKIELRGIPEDKAKKIYKVAKSAFRDIEVVSEITGEVLATHYTSADWFVPLCSFSCAMDTIIEIYEGK